MPGTGMTAAQQVMAEVGCQAEEFSLAGHNWLLGWGLVGREQSAGRSRSDRSSTGNRAMRSLVTQMAWRAVHINGSFFQQLFRRLVPRLGIQKALGCVPSVDPLDLENSARNVSYQECGGTPEPPTIQRRKQRLLRQLKKLGYSAVLTPNAPAG